MRTIIAMFLVVYVTFTSDDGHSKIKCPVEVTHREDGSVMSAVSPISTARCEFDLGFETLDVIESTKAEEG